MTDAVNNNNDKTTNVSGDKNNLPYQNGSIDFISGNDSTEEIGLRSFRGIGVALPPITALVGATHLQLMCSDRSGGQFVQVGDDIALHATEWTPFMTTDVAFWNVAKFNVVGTLTGSGTMPYNRT